MNVKQLAANLTPTVVVSIAATILAALAAFHVTLSPAEYAATLAFVGAASIVALKSRTVESISALVGAGIAVAVAFGLPVSSAQSEAILLLVVTAAGIALGKPAVGAVKAKLARTPTPQAGEWRRDAPYATGRRKPKDAPAIKLSQILSGIVPAHPAVVDHFGNLAFGLYGNDRFGVCGPTSVANLVRLVTGGLLGSEVVPSQQDVYDLYRLSGNPNFNPNAAEPEDNGVEMQQMLDALLKHGIGDGKGGKVKPVAFAKVDELTDEALTAAVSIFGGVLWGINLEVAQQAQTNLNPPLWDHKASEEWGGHAVLNGADEAAGLEDVISWAKRVETTTGFRRSQLEEAWVIVWPWNVEHPAFQAGVSLTALAQAYKALTGKELVLPPTPAPVPTGGATAADITMWEGVRPWAVKRHTSAAVKPVVARLLAWAKASGLS